MILTKPVRTTIKRLVSESMDFRPYLRTILIPSIAQRACQESEIVWILLRPEFKQLVLEFVEEEINKQRAQRQREMVLDPQSTQTP